MIKITTNTELRIKLLFEKKNVLSIKASLIKVNSVYYHGKITFHLVDYDVCYKGYFHENEFKNDWGIKLETKNPEILK